MKFIKILLNLFLSLFLVVLIVWGAAFVLLQSEKGQHWALEKIISIAEEKTGAQIKIGRIELFLPFTLRVESLQIKKNNELDLSFNRVDVTYSSPRLLEGRLAFSNIEGQGIFINQLPLSHSPESSSEWTLDYFKNFYVKIKHFKIDDLHINPSITKALLQDPLLGDILKDAIFSVEGHFRNIPSGAGADIGMAIIIKNHSLSQEPIHFNFDIKNDFLNVGLNIQEFPLELFKENFKGYLANINLQSNGDIGDWQNLLNDRHNNIEAFFKFDAKNSSPQNVIGQFLGNKIALEGQLNHFSREQIEIKNIKFSTQEWELLAEGNVREFKHIDHANFSGQYKKTNVHFEGAIKNDELLLTLLHGPERYLLSANYNYSDTEIRLNRLLIQNDHLNINGDIVTHFSPLLVNGYLNFEMFDTKPLALFTDEKIEGGFKGSVQIANRGISSLQEVMIVVNGENVAFREWKAKKGEISLETAIELIPFPNYAPIKSKVFLEDFLGINNFTAQTLKIESTQDFFFFPINLKNIDARLFANHLSLDNHHVEDLSFETTIKTLEYPFDGKIKGMAKEISTAQIGAKELTFETALSHDENPFTIEGKELSLHSTNIKLGGLWNYKQDTFSVAIQHSQGQIGDHPFSLLSPFKITYKDATTFNLTPFKFRFNQGIFEGSLIAENSELSLNCDGTEVPTELLQLFYKDLPITGLFSFQTDLKGNLKAPTGKIAVVLHQMQITEEIFAGKASIQGLINLDIAPEILNLNAALRGVGRNPVSAKGTLPISFSLLPFNFSINKETPFEMVLQAEGELDPYLHLFFNDNTNLTGQTKINLTLFGNINNPEIKGEIDLFHGMYESLSTGAVFKNIRARIEGDGSRMVLKNFFAEDTKHGSIAGEGYLSLDSSQNFPFSFKINPKHIFVLDSDYASIAASGQLILSGDKNGGVIKGQLIADSANIRMEEALPTQIKTVEVRYVSSKNDNKTSPAATENKWPLTLEIQGRLPKNVTISGKKLQSEWRGDVFITGNPSNPLINGELRVVNGQYDFNGKIFTLTQGSIHFAGPTDKKTSLYIVASKEIGKIKADIIVKGPTSKLAVSFRSNPPLSQREILSYILFNHGIADITPDEGDMLSQSFMELNDSDQPQTDFLTRLRTNMGIDRLDFATGNDDNKDLSLQIGKYIREGVMVSINKGLNASNGVAIEAKLHKNIQVQGEISDSAEGKIQLRWKKDY